MSTGGGLKATRLFLAEFPGFLFFLPPWLREVLVQSLLIGLTFRLMVQSDSVVGAGGFLARSEFDTSLLLCG